MRFSLLRLVVLLAGVAALLTAPSGALGRSTANPTIRVQFSLTGPITVTGPSGAPLGTATGTPPTIPAGYYTLLLVGPGGCAVIPYFELKGPAENGANNLT